KFLVITFVPHPSFVLKNQRAFLLNTYAERREMLREIGVEYLLEIDFNRDFSTLTPGDFLDTYVFNHSGIAKMFLGHDFAFGANKSGDFKFVKDYCVNKKIDLLIQDEYKFNSANVSSSAVRAQVKNGAMDVASNLLGRNYFISGRVIKGAGRGKQIGFPTANLGYERECIVPSNGVYITRTYFKEMTYQSVTNVGHNPTFNTGLDIHVETHVLDFNLDIYGEEIRVEFIKKLRDEKKFSSANELIQQIKMDVENSRKYFI
ncbi:MAG: riboflavin biosynthesis protein RibF, partial [Bacteriovoracaceae bacterium]|nr:riboflavin biosynthesis protein RibF [Bacteriovoracaceae bacterium]